MGDSVRYLDRWSLKTLRSYQHDLKMFEASGGHFPCLDDKEIIRWIKLDEANHKSFATIRRHVAALATLHKVNDYEDLTKTVAVTKCLAAVEERIGFNHRRMEPITSADLRRYVGMLDRSDLQGLRRMTLVSWAFYGAFLRSEIPHVLRSHLEDTPERGYRVKIASTKKYKEIIRFQDPDVCPVRMMDEWLEKANIRSGPVFRRLDRWGNVLDTAMSQGFVAQAVKDMAEALGRNRNVYSGLSFRRGFAMEAFIRGASFEDIAKQTHHESLKSIEELLGDLATNGTNAVYRFVGD